MDAPSPLTVVFASDARGVLPLSVAAWSVLEAAAAQTVYDICILSDGIPEDEQKKLRQVLVKAGERHSVRFIDLVSVFGETLNIDEKKWTGEGWPRATWGRIAAPELLPEVNRALYLDIDTLVCTDLSELFATEMGDAALGVVLEQESHAGSRFNESLDIPLDCIGYFNAGVLLMNFSVFRRDGLVKRVMEYAQEHSDVLACLDQDALNGALCHRLIQIHPRWNWHDGLTRQILKWNPKAKLWRGNSPKTSIEAALWPGILHYQGMHKPWRYNHRPEGPRYERSMLNAGLVDHLPLPGWNIKDCIKRMLYAPMYAVTWWRIRRLARRFGITGAPQGGVK